MKLGVKGMMNIDFSETYDQEDDIYYVTFKTGEPSYCIEWNDVLLLEVGIFTNLPTGFRILNFKKNKIKMVNLNIILRDMKSAISHKSQPTLQERQAAIRGALEKVLA